MPANNHYLAQHQSNEVKADLKQMAIDARASEIFNEYFDNLDGDFYSMGRGSKPCEKGENLFDHLDSMPYESFALIAEAVKSKDFINIGKVLFDELTKQITIDAKYQAEKELG
ncbi:MAG: hypothetical protein WC810_28215 [Janthinobacterium sp.]|jgi:hypothetical protein